MILRHTDEHPKRLPVIRYAVLLFLLITGLVVAVAVSLDQSAQRSTSQQAATALGGGAHVAASAFAALRSNLRVRASQLATSLPLQRAVVTHDEAGMRRIAAAHNALIVSHGQTIGALPPSPRLTSTATITDGVHRLALVTVAVPLAKDLLTLIRQATPLPAHGALVFAYRGQVVAGGPRGASAHVRDGRIVLGGTTFAAQSAPLPLAGASILAIEPEAAVDAVSQRYRRLVILAALATLAMTAVLATRLARPIAHVVGDVARLRRQAQTDSLTGLANHRALGERLELELARAEQQNASVSLVIADVDNFKLINDTYGHQRGDELLTAVARHIGESVRELDLGARQGGDEFAIVLPGARLTDARNTADRVRRAVAQLDVTMSLGVAEFPTYATAGALVAAADAALYEAKRGGKNRVATATVQGQPVADDPSLLLASVSLGSG